MREYCLGLVKVWGTSRQEFRSRFWTNSKNEKCVETGKQYGDESSFKGKNAGIQKQFFALTLYVPFDSFNKLCCQ